MRHLLIAAYGILLASPAMAVDYVKCEAMQRAYDRAVAKRNAIDAEIVREVSWRYWKKECGEDPSSSCMAQISVTSNEQKMRDIVNDPRSKPYQAKVLQIKKDLIKSGCP